MLCQAQCIFAAMTAVASKTKLQNLVLAKKEIQASEFDDAIVTFEETYRDAKLVLTSGTLRVFQLVPR